MLSQQDYSKLNHDTNNTNAKKNKTVVKQSKKTKSVCSICCADYCVKFL